VTGAPLCPDCPDREACSTGWPCARVRAVANQAREAGARPLSAAVAGREPNAAREAGDRGREPNQAREAPVAGLRPAVDAALADAALAGDGWVRLTRRRDGAVQAARVPPEAVLAVDP
jgi:hypothetical protein